MEETKHSNKNKVGVYIHRLKWKVIEMKNTYMYLKTLFLGLKNNDFRMYLFSVKNPHEVENNQEPDLEEVGPFSYLEQTERVNEVFSEVAL